MLIKKSKTKEPEKGGDMNHLSKRASRMKPSGTMKVANQAKALKNSGIKVYDLGAGDPDFAPPQSVIEATGWAAKNGKTHYPHGRGEKTLRQAIASKYQREYGLVYDPEAQILVTPGGKKAVSLALAALLNPGDEVIVVKPYWTSYSDLVELWEGVPVFFDPENGFDQLARLLEENKKIKAIILNSPANPSGSVLSEQDIAVLAEIMGKKDIWVISDEIYEKIIFPPAVFHCLANHLKKEKTIIINGVSKTYAMTGYRLGYALGPSEVIKAMANILGNDVGPSCSISQEAARAALTDPEAEAAVQKMVAKYHQRYREIVLPFAKQLSLQYYEAQGAFYFFFRLPKKFGTDCESFCSQLLGKKQVALVPGSAFGKPGWVRICFAVADEDLAEGLKRLGDFLKE